MPILDELDPDAGEAFDREFDISLILQKERSEGYAPPRWTRPAAPLRTIHFPKLLPKQI